MIIDFQHHYFPEELIRKHGGRPGQFVVWRERGRPKLNLHDGLHNVEEHLETMDIAGIDVAVLTCWDPPLEECKIINDRLFQLQKQYPERIVGLVHVPPLRGEVALAELERGIKVLGLKGVAITAQVEGKPLDSPGLWPFYEKVQELDIPIHVHSSSLLLGFPALKAPYDLSRKMGWEFDLVTATVRLIMGGVLEDFPELKIIISHFGGGIAAIVERLETMEFPPHRPKPKKSFREYLDMLYFDMAGSPGGMGAVKCALTALRPERLVFGTDYPQAFYGKAMEIKGYVENIKKLNLSQEAKERMLGENAAELLALGRK